MTKPVLGPCIYQGSLDPPLVQQRRIALYRRKDTYTLVVYHQDLGMSNNLKAEKGKIENVYQ